MENKTRPKFSLGIDLGTTNCVLSFCELNDDETKSDSSNQSKLQLLPIPQLVAPNQIESHTSLPSFLYLLDANQQQSDDFAISYDGESKIGLPVVSGRYARQISAEQPDRVVAAAKSWLSHEGADRHANILPWTNGFEQNDSPKISPVRATQLLIEHMVESWQAAYPDAPIAQQQVTLTVPACFDEGARQLTRSAAIAAGLPDTFVLLEEPQAAMYNWILQQGDQWRKSLSVGDSILIVDVGGGTTDLTWIDVIDESGNLELSRRAVGPHLLVGGDNMDLALAHFAAQKFSANGHELNPWQSTALWHACRAAKERLLSDENIDSTTVTVLGRGRKLIGNSISVDLTRDEVSRLLVDGFLPQCGREEMPQSNVTTGFQEVGLPYEQDTGLTRHMAGFLTRHQSSQPSESSDVPDTDTTPSTVALPNKLLLNGGVFKSIAFRNRVKEVVESWNSAVQIELLNETNGEDTSGDTLRRGLDEAVACGACFYGETKLGKGIRIRGGTARSYYIGIETAGLAVPGMPRPLNAVCVLPAGTEEGSEIDIPGGPVGLVVGRKARFRFFESDSRKSDSVGTVLRQWTDEELAESAPLELELECDDLADGNLLPVQFHSKITELGVFELWCHSTRDETRYKLELNTRDQE